MEIDKRKYDLIIIGGGVVGAAAAYFTSSLGGEVLLLEKAAVGEGCTQASAGLVVLSHYESAANPNNIVLGLGSFFNKHSPISIRPRVTDGWPHWTMRFVRAGLSSREFFRSREVLLEISRLSKLVHRDLSKRGGQDYRFQSRGLLMVFRKEKSFKQAADRAGEDKRRGITSVLLEGDQVNEFEPWLDGRVAGGLFYPEDAHVAPRAFARWMADMAVQKGAAIVTGAEVFAFGRSGKRVTFVLTTKGEFRADQVVLAAGSWMGTLTKQLGRRLPIKGAKGYSLFFPRLREMPRHPLLLEDEHIAIAPHPDHLRLTSGLELCDIEPGIRLEAIRSIVPAARHYSSRLGGEGPVEVRVGFRPMPADGLPLVGRLEKGSNVLIAGGHGQEGITQGPLAGKQIADLLSDGSIEDIGTALAPSRFF